MRQRQKKIDDGTREGKRHRSLEDNKTNQSTTTTEEGNKTMASAANGHGIRGRRWCLSGRTQVVLAAFVEATFSKTF